MDKAALLALADRVEAMTGPCFDVEDQIEKITRQPWRFPPPNYTVSLDAAMTLVPEGGFGSLVAGRFPDGSIGYVAVVTRPNRAEGTANRAALALTAAALRAIAGGEDA